MADDMRSDEPAFPADEVHGDGVQQIKRHLGLTVREYAAIAALQGLIASPETNDLSYDEVSARAWSQADSFLAARAGGQS